MDHWWELKYPRWRPKRIKKSVMGFQVIDEASRVRSLDKSTSEIMHLIWKTYLKKNEEHKVHLFNTYFTDHASGAQSAIRGSSIWSENCRALTIRKISSVPRPIKGSLMAIWRRIPRRSITKCALEKNTTFNIGQKSFLRYYRDVPPFPSCF